MKPALWLVAMLFFFGLLPIAKADVQPHMKRALVLLRTPKDADHPKPTLVAARDELKDAKKNKGGSIAQAMKDLDEAIALVTTGADKDKVKQKINAAIANVQNGMGNSN